MSHIGSYRGELLDNGFGKMFIQFVSQLKSRSMGGRLHAITAWGFQTLQPVMFK